MSTHYLDLTPSQFRARLADAPIAYLPLGTLEWHSEHLPLGTDAILSSGFFTALAERVGGIVLPPLFLGPDRIGEIAPASQAGGESVLIGMDFCTFPKDDPAWYEDRQLDGSAYWVPTDVFLTLLRSTFRQLARAGFKIVVAHGHGPSTHHYAEGVPDWEQEFGLRCFTCTDIAPGETGIQTDHAAVNETSLMMALRPELVDMAALSGAPSEYPVGIWGDDPRNAATPEIGRRAIQTQVVRMETVLRAALKELNRSP